MLLTEIRRKKFYYDFIKKLVDTIKISRFRNLLNLPSVMIYLSVSNPKNHGKITLVFRLGFTIQKKIEESFPF